MLCVQPLQSLVVSSAVCGQCIVRAQGWYLRPLLFEVLGELR